MYPPMPAKNVQKISMTVASAPRFDGDRKPSSENTTKHQL